MTSSRRLRAFKRWMNSQGVEYSGEALKFVDSIEEGISVRALRDLKEGEVVGSIPKSACLTIKNSGACELIETAELGGYLGLAVAIMYEKSLGEESPWAGYLQVLPERESLPLVWTLDEVDHFLCGTELHKIVKEDKALIYEDWKESILPLLDLWPLNPTFFGVEQYFASKSLVASRAFEIDNYHGFGMVPLADLFNHKTGAEDVHLTSVSSHSESDNTDDSDLDGLPTECGVYEKPSSGSERSMILEMIMVKDVKAGAEVFNTYGSMGNAALLHRYGFTEPDNEYDIVNIDLELVLQWSSTLFSDRYSRARLALWRRLDYSSCVSQNAEYFEISFDGKPQVELLSLLHIMLLQEDLYHKLDLSLSTASHHKESMNVILLEKCGATLDKSSEISRDLLLTEEVCRALLWLADKRESFYGLKSTQDDIGARKRCDMKERKQYHSLMLRVSERKILKRLRSYVSYGARSLKTSKKTSARKRLKGN
ncbi:hypothetical protein K2173_000971 [Erythroxylum novogranatense]|uniref:N-lysine methyltransferase n=1 Tax=Erythroxylum novogranatense TaxID=1862640 RepID=A0AAV8TQG8_9ROSI|nr:hypothetical protein K2173_000971 [Erythroxylum novogranatense]